MSLAFLLQRESTTTNGDAPLRSKANNSTTTVTYHQRPHSAAPYHAAPSAQSSLGPCAAHDDDHVGEQRNEAASSATPVLRTRHSAKICASDVASQASSSSSRPKSADASTYGKRSDLLILQRQLHQLTQPFASHFFWRRRQCVDDEVDVRRQLTLCMLQASSDLIGALVQQQETAHFAEITKRRRDEAFLPWCNQRCRYCCTHRLHWAEHSTSMWMSLRLDLVQQESIVRQSLGDGLMSELNGLLNYFHANARAHDFLVAQQQTLEAEWLHVMTILQLHEARSFQTHLVDAKDKCLTWWRAECDRVALCNRERDADRQAESASVSYGRAMAQTAFCMREHEAEQRRGLVQREVNERVDLRARMEAQGSQVMQTLWRAANDAVFDELQALRQYKADVEAAQRKAEEDRVAAIKAEWAKELADIKRLKKQGPPKGQQPLPPCGRCGQVPAKDEFTHRIQECTERPVACPKCTEIMPFSRLDAHKGLCPQRIVQCTTCLHYYKASYLETTHAVYCAVLPEMEKLLKVPNECPTSPGGSTVGEATVWSCALDLPRPSSDEPAEAMTFLWADVQRWGVTTPTSSAANSVGPVGFLKPQPPLLESESNVAAGQHASVVTLTQVDGTAVLSWEDVAAVLQKHLTSGMATIAEFLAANPQPPLVDCSFLPRSGASCDMAPLVQSVRVVPVLHANTSVIYASFAQCWCCELIDSSQISPSTSMHSEALAVKAVVDALVSKRCSSNAPFPATSSSPATTAMCGHHVAWAHFLCSRDMEQYCKPQIERKSKGKK